MMRALDIAATGLRAQDMNLTVISNNLANLTTTSYKAQRAEFEDLLYQSFKRTGQSSSDAITVVPTGVQLGLGVNTGSITRDTTQGTLQVTDNPLDLAIRGKGFFQVQLPNGEIAYTRDGTLGISPQGELVTQDGYLFEPAILIPDDAISVGISPDGIVEAFFREQPAPTQIGQIELVNFINPEGLDAIGDNLYLQTFASGDPLIGVPNEEGFGNIFQGGLEQSNVDSVEEITKLITAQRAYEMNTNILSAADEMLQSLNQSA